MKNNKEKNMKILILVVLILVIAIGVGIGLLMSKKESTNNTENITKNENINSEVIIVKKLSPKGWTGDRKSVV